MTDMIIGYYLGLAVGTFIVATIAYGVVKKRQCPCCKFPECGHKHE